MFKFESDEVWKTYDSNVQSYRSNLFSTQSILLAVVAIILDKATFLTMLTSVLIPVIGLIQMWVIWFPIIRKRIRIVDYYKYGMGKIFDNEGNFLLSGVQFDNCLKEDVYANDRTIRHKVNRIITTRWGRKTKKGEKILPFGNFRMTRIKIDILIPVSFTLIWVFFFIIALKAFLPLVLALIRNHI
jgi:hypothetical protein